MSLLSMEGSEDPPQRHYRYVSDIKPGVLILMGPYMDVDYMEATVAEEVMAATEGSSVMVQC